MAISIRCGGCIGLFILRRMGAVAGGDREVFRLSSHRSGDIYSEHKQPETSRSKSSPRLHNLSSYEGRRFVT
jgi:hypothetical protein